MVLRKILIRNSYNVKATNNQWINHKFKSNCKLNQITTSLLIFFFNNKLKILIVAIIRCLSNSNSKTKLNKLLIIKEFLKEYLILKSFKNIIIINLLIIERVMTNTTMRYFKIKASNSTHYNQTIATKKIFPNSYSLTIMIHQQVIFCSRRC